MSSWTVAAFWVEVLAGGLGLAILIVQDIRRLTVRMKHRGEGESR